MCTLKLAGALVAALAFTAFAAATAPAAETLWELLPGTTGTQFTGKSGKMILQTKGGSSIACSGSEREGELTSERTLGLAWVRITGCSALGISINSLGEEPNVILTHVESHSCLIEPGDLGLLFKLLPLHLEVPATSLLLSVQGAFIALVTPVGKKISTFTASVQQKAGQQSITKCEGSKTEDKLEKSTDGGEFIQSGLEVKEGTLTFATEQEAME